MLDLVQDFSKNFCSFFAGTRCEIFGILSLIFVYICWVFCKVEHCKHCWLMDTAGWFQHTHAQEPVRKAAARWTQWERRAVSHFSMHEWLFYEVANYDYAFISCLLLAFIIGAISSESEFSQFLLLNFLWLQPEKRLNLTGKPWQSLRPRLAFDDPVELPRDERWDRGCRDVESCRPGVYNNNVSIVDSFYYISIYFKWKDRMYDKWIFGRSIYAF